MARLLKLRFLDTSKEDNDTYIEVYCDENHKYRGYFRKINKELAKQDSTTIKPNKDEIFEVRLLGSGWKNISKKKFEKQLEFMNELRASRQHPLIELPNQED